MLFAALFIFTFVVENLMNNFDGKHCKMVAAVYFADIFGSIVGIVCPVVHRQVELRLHH